MFKFEISDYTNGKYNGNVVVHEYNDLASAEHARNAFILSYLEYKHYYYCHLITRRNIGGLHIDMQVQNGKQFPQPIVRIGYIEEV